MLFRITRFPRPTPVFSGGGTASSLLISLLLFACSSDPEGAKPSTDAGSTGTAGNPPTSQPPIKLDSGVILDPPGNPQALCAIPKEAELVAPANLERHTVGSGTPESCTSSAFVAAVASGGYIDFDCGPDEVTITLEETAKVFNDKGPDIVIDGGKKIILNGDGKHRILYMNTCDEAQKWTTSHCNDQDHPRLSVQNITMINGHQAGESNEDGGGAIFARGGQLKIISSNFFNNSCEAVGQDVGGGAVRVFDQFEDREVFVVDSVFGGSEELGNHCSNGGALSSIGTSYTIINSSFSYNQATGNGANPKKAGTPGGGSGGAIYNDGNLFHLNICGTLVENNDAVEGGGAIFFVSNNRTGTLTMTNSIFSNNPSAGFETKDYPGMFILTDEPIVKENTTIEE